ncbi:hypothetical protein C0992_010485, partial [Termitomyces sp. T32_za158]
MGALDKISDLVARVSPSGKSRTSAAGIGNGHGMVHNDDNMIVSKPAIVFHSSQIFFDFLAMACFASVASFQAKWKVGPSGLTGFALFISIMGMFLSAFMLAVPVVNEKHDKLVRLARALKEVRVGFILTGVGVAASLLISDLGDDFKKGLDGFCSSKKAGAVFFWLAFGEPFLPTPRLVCLPNTASTGFWAASLVLLVLDWRSGKLTTHSRARDPPFRVPTRVDDVEDHVPHEDEDEDEDEYTHVQRPAQPAASSLYTPSRYDPDPDDNAHTHPGSPFADENRYAGRPSVDAYGAFSDPAPSGFVQVQPQAQAQQ